MTMGTNSDQCHWLDAVTDETLPNGEFNDNEDEVLASFFSFEFLEGLQPQSQRNGKGC